MQSINVMLLLLTLTLTVSIISETPITSAQSQKHNTSICSSFPYKGLYYHLNPLNNNTDFSNNISTTVKYIYNMCQQVEIYCDHRVVTASLVMVEGEKCWGYEQEEVRLKEEDKLDGGVVVSYRRDDERIQIGYECKDGKGDGCPHVDDSILFDFLSRQELGFTIFCEILGVLLMLLGIYIYRVSIVLISACTMFIILIFIEVPIVFYRGVTDSFLISILILNAICSFFGGYVAAYFPKIGVFILGGWVGIIISLTLNNIAFYYIKSDPANLTLWIFMPIVAVAFGIMALCVRKTFIIFATSLIGAYLCLRALSWHLGAFPNEFLYARKYQLGLVGVIQWQFYLYVVALLILAASSSALQYWLFRRKVEQMGNGEEEIDEHFQRIEEQLKAKREDFVKFQNIFEKKSMDSQPKVLSKNKGEDVFEENSESDGLE